MAYRTKRRTVDLSGYPDLVVIYLGMRVNALTGLKTLLGFGPRTAKAARDLAHSLYPSLETGKLPSESVTLAETCRS